MVPLSAVARLDLLVGGGGGNHERRRCQLLGGSGGMLPRKILNNRISEIAFSAFGEHLFAAIFFVEAVNTIHNFDPLIIEAKH